MRKIKRTEAEIDQLLNLCGEWEDAGGSSLRGATYEAGVRAALDWVFGDIDDAPVEEAPPEAR
jgi:hypothetical protein